MHELGIACALVEAAEAEARKHNARRVLGVSCRIGAIRQVMPDALREGFALAASGTLAVGAALHVTVTGMMLDCSDCACKEELPAWAFECPRCHSMNVRLSGGDDLELTSVELEVPDDGPCCP